MKVALLLLVLLQTAVGGVSAKCGKPACARKRPPLFLEKPTEEAVVKPAILEERGAEVTDTPTTAAPVAALAWSYDNAKDWAKDHATCNGKLQSPININTRLSRNVNWIIETFDYDKAPEWIITNTGTTIRFHIDSTTSITPTLNIISENQTYVFAEGIFHWGKGMQGSEHLIDGVKMPLELQLIHVNQKYTNSQEALGHPDGQLIISIMIQVGRASTPFNPLIDSLKELRGAEHQTALRKKSFSINQILPKVQTVYSYKGSLTTPPCPETVHWLVCKETITISKVQLEEFQRLCKDEEAEQLIGQNFRPAQKLFGRIPNAVKLKIRQAKKPLLQDPAFYAKYDWKALFRSIYPSSCNICS